MKRQQANVLNVREGVFLQKKQFFLKKCEIFLLYDLQNNKTWGILGNMMNEIINR